MTDYLKLLLAYRALPVRSRARTLMEVAGYPHYENVASNILAFFFQPSEEHGLGDLLITSLAWVVQELEVECPSDVMVHREYGTSAGGRLDLLIVSDSLVIGIENKIYHHLANDFSDYGRVIEETGPQAAARLKVVLSPRSIRGHEGMTQAGFVSLTYCQLWAIVRDRLGRRVHLANPKWLNYLIDFMETTTRISGESGELTANDEFLIQNNEIISQLINDRQDLLNRLNRMVLMLKEQFDEHAIMIPHMKERWVYKGSCLVHDFASDGMCIALDLYVTIDGWELNFFNRPKTPLAYLNHLCSQPSLKDRVSKLAFTNGRYQATVWPLQTPVAELHLQLQDWAQAISDAISSQRSMAQGIPASEPI